VKEIDYDTIKKLMESLENNEKILEKARTLRRRHGTLTPEDLATTFTI